MDVEDHRPQTGRLIKEDGTVVNIGDFLDDRGQEKKHLDITVPNGETKSVEGGYQLYKNIDEINVLVKSETSHDFAVYVNGRVESVGSGQIATNSVTGGRTVNVGRTKTDFLELDIVIENQDTADHNYDVGIIWWEK